MLIHSTCRDCGGSLLVTNDDTVHPLCEPRPTKIERLEQEWLEAEENGEFERAMALSDYIGELHMRPPRLLEAALAYAAWGWPVFPLKPLAKTPATRNGFKDATTDRERINAWWKRHPNSNIGLPTGHSFDVIDIDVPDGIPTLQQLQNENRSIHGYAATASGGNHLYITATGKGNHARWLPGTDYRGQGGYVVAPPSTLGPAKNWSWIHHPSPFITGVGDTYGIK